MSLASPNCEVCPLNAEESRRIYSRGPADAEVVVIGKCPDADDIAAGKPFSGAVGKDLAGHLARAGWDCRSLLITNAVLCQPPDKYSMTKKGIECCAPVLYSLLKQHPRKLIIALGNEAFSAVMHVNPSGVEKGAGLVKETEYGCPVVWAHHPNKVRLTPNLSAQFVSHLKKALHIYTNGVNHDPAESARKTIVRNLESLRAVVEMLKERGQAGEVLAFDIETTGLDRFDNEILGIAFGFCDSGAYVPLKHGAQGDWSGFDLNSPEHEHFIAEYTRLSVVPEGEKAKDRKQRTDELQALAQIVFPVEDYAAKVEMLREILEDGSIEKTAHNGKFDTTFIANKLDIHVRGYTVDPMLLHQLLDENLPHGLKYLARQEFNAPDYDAEMQSYYKPGKHLGMASLRNVAKYACLDVIYTARLARQYLIDAQKQDLLAVHDRLLMPLTYELGQLELNGMMPDQEALEHVGERLELRMAQVEQDINDITGMGETKLPHRKDKQIGVNANSDADMRYLLFDYYGLPVQKLTDSKQPSVDKEVREALLEIEGLPIITRKFLEAIDEYSKLNTFYGTFVKGTRRAIRSDGRVHCSYGYNQKSELSPNTGRLSCSDPNLQNVAKPFQAIYIPAPGYMIVQPDFSAIEVRVWAAYSRDPGLMKYIGTPGMDFHRQMGAVILDKHPDDVTKEERGISKIIVFGGIMYGGNEHIAVKQIGCSLEEAKLFLSRIYKRFPTGKAWLDGVVRQAHETHQVRSFIGRTRHLHDIVSASKQVRQGAERIAMNSPIQGQGSDKNNAALIEMADWIRWYGTGAPWLPTDEETSWDWLERRLTYRVEIEEALREIRCNGPAIPARLVNTIHDANVAEVREDYVEMYVELCHAKMTRRLCKEWPESLPLAIEVAVTKRWHDDVLDEEKICRLYADL
ncbi:MAG: DNA polymerase [Armatimonadota bacterium]